MRLIKHIIAASALAGVAIAQTKREIRLAAQAERKARKAEEREQKKQNSGRYQEGYQAGLDTCIPPSYDDWSSDANADDFNTIDDLGRVHVNDGFMQCQTRDNTMHCNGIRYADKPVRFSHPTAPKPWKGVYQATKALEHVPGCIHQYGGDDDSQPDIQSEDCLFMNIVTPSPNVMGLANTTLPVIVFVHGGTWKRSSASDHLYNGNRLANGEGTIVVTFNYRLGALGFFRYTPLSAIFPGNQGAMDIIQALRWVKANIHHFGGDSDNVTLMGQSAGADLVGNLVAMNPSHAAYSENLFHKAVIMSAPWLVPSRNLGASYGQADIIGGQLMKFTTNADGTACSEVGAAAGSNAVLAAQLTIGCMMMADPHSFGTASGNIQAMQPTGTVNAMTGQPNVKVTTMISEWGVTLDGALFDMQNFAAFESGRVMDIPLIMGATTGDGVTHVYGFVHENFGAAYEMGEAAQSGSMFNMVMSTVYKDSAAAIKAAQIPTPVGMVNYYDNPCPGGVTATCDNRVTLGLQFGDFLFRCPMQHFATGSAYATEHTSDTFLYLFDQPQDSTLESKYMRDLCDNFVCHSADVAYWFGSFDKDKYNHDEDQVDKVYNVDADDWKLSHRMRNNLGNFAHNSNPNDWIRPGGLEMQEDLQVDCWPKANDPSYCQNDATDFWHRIYSHERYSASDEITLFKREDFATYRCSFWHGLNKWNDF